MSCCGQNDFASPSQELQESFIRGAKITCAIGGGAHPNVIHALGYHPSKPLMCFGMSI